MLNSDNEKLPDTTGTIAILSKMAEKGYALLRFGINGEVVFAGDDGRVSFGSWDDVVAFASTI